MKGHQTGSQLWSRGRVSPRAQCRPSLHQKEDTVSRISVTEVERQPPWLRRLCWVVVWSVSVSCSVISRVWFCDPIDCSPPGSSVHGDSPGKKTGVGCCVLLQGIFLTQDWTRVSYTAGRFFTIWARRQAPRLGTFEGCSEVFG